MTTATQPVPIGHYIQGQRAMGTSTRSQDVTNPATGVVTGRVVLAHRADVDAAVDAAVFGAFANSGQICMSTERIVVDSSIADDFVAKLGARAAALPLGDPRKGPVS